jgi:uncharacterized damage-inducible protein DinB
VGHTDNLTELFRHKTWATTTLIEFCMGQTNEVLDFVRDGAFGSIRETLRHLVNSDYNYQRRLLDEERSSLQSGDTGALLARYVNNAGQWLVLVTDDAIADRLYRSDDGWQMPGHVLIAQACHHDDEHRAQILTLLGAQGVEVPELGVWEYAMATGEMHELDL